MSTARKQQMRRKRDRRRIDLPALDYLGPWPTQSPERSRATIIEGMRAMRQWPRNIASNRLVPEDIRSQSAERWRNEQFALLMAEKKLWQDWQSRRWWRRLIDWQMRRQAPPKPAPKVAHSVIDLNGNAKTTIPFSRFDDRTYTDGHSYFT